MQKQPFIILGIDPGTVVMGYSVIRVENGKVSVLDMDVLKLSRYKDPYEKLRWVHQKVTDLIATHHPNSFAIEAPFFGKNVQSMLKLGRAQGVAIAAAMQNELSVTEYSPKKVKQSITGNGNADKEQVRKMLCHILESDIQSRYYDATDALAVAICHHFNTRIASAPLPSKKVSKKKPAKNSWSNFIAQNPGRVIKK